MTLADVVLLLAAGLVAAVIGTGGGITSLVSYPALLLAGLSPFAANVVNLVALVACLPGSALASRRELADTRSWLRAGSAAAAVGAGLGTVLLLTTPSSVFDRVVPVLVAAGALALLAQPWLTARRRAHGRGGRGPTLVLVALVSVYGGYFGAGSGVMLLALALVLVDARLPQANAVKNVLIGVGTVASGLLLVCVGPVRWDAVAPLALGAFSGSLLGPVLARRLPARAVRLGVVALGLGLAVELWLNPA